MNPESDNYTLCGKYSSIQDILSKNENELRLDLGCGFSKPEGFIGIDNLVGKATQIVSENHPDILMDLNNDPIPFPDESCVEIRSSHFLEHSNLSWIIDESHRMLKKNAIFLFAVPYANSAEGMYPGHSQFLTEKWFFENINFQNKFHIVNIEYFPSLYWQKSLARFFIPFGFARIFLFNACWQMIVRCVKR